MERWIDFDKLILLNGYIGLILLGSAFISVGIFISSLTQSQIIAATITFGVSLLFWLIGWLSDIVEKYANFFTYISLYHHFENFTKGILDTRDVIFYLSFIVFFSYLTLKILLTKKYRG